MARKAAPSTRLTAVTGAADRVYKELKAFTDERRITSSARRLTALPTEAVVATTAISGGGLIAAITLGMLHVIGVLTIAGLAVPLSMTACGGLGVLGWRTLRPRLDRRTSLEILSDELQQLDSDEKAPKSYREAVYSLRERALAQRLGLAAAPEPRLLQAAPQNVIDIIPDEAAVKTGASI